MMITACELRSTLSHFSGTSSYVRDPLTGLLYTEGIVHLADRAEAHWLLTDIGAVFRFHPAVKGVRFQLWILAVDRENKAVLTCSEDSDTPVIYEQKYEYTDFPVGSWKMYLVDGVLMVPSEY